MLEVFLNHSYMYWTFVLLFKSQSLTIFSDIIIRYLSLFHVDYGYFPCLLFTLQFCLWCFWFRNTLNFYKPKELFWWFYTPILHTHTEISIFLLTTFFPILQWVNYPPIFSICVYGFICFHPMYLISLERLYYVGYGANLFFP